MRVNTTLLSSKKTTNNETMEIFFNVDHGFLQRLSVVVVMVMMKDYS